jgi:hypothetical protein
MSPVLLNDMISNLVVLIFCCDSFHGDFLLVVAFLTWKEQRIDRKRWQIVIL